MRCPIRLLLACLMVGCAQPQALKKEGGSLPLPLVAPAKVAQARLVDVIFEAIPMLYGMYPDLFLNERLPFQTGLGPEGKLAVYDPGVQDVFLYPGAGCGIRAITEALPGKFVFTRDGKAWVYDILKEGSCLLHQPTPGWVIEAYPDALSNVYCLVAETPEQRLAGVGVAYRIPAAYPGLVPVVLEQLASASVALLGKPIIVPDPFCPWPPLLAPEALCKINAIGEEHAGIASIRPTARGDLLVFTTGDGGLFLYHFDPPTVTMIPTFQDGKAAYATIDGLFGRYIAWEDPERHRIAVWDRLCDCLDPVPFLNLYLENTGGITAIPDFYNVDPRHLYVLIVYGDGKTGLIAYDLISEEILGLALINNTLACP